MPRPPLEVADVFRAHAWDFLQAHGTMVSSAKRRVLRLLIACRTAGLGGFRYLCSAKCGFEHFAYKSCRNRHCPKCQATAAAEWLEARAEDLLPVEYFHVVFTVPTLMAEIALQNKRVMYNVLFRASSETLNKIAADPKHLGAKLGFIGLLHTWGQNLLHHPHVHYLVPGGGLSLDGERWISCASGFFLPVRVLSRVFRGKFLDLTQRAFARGELSFAGHLAPLADPHAFARRLASTYDTDWVVYTKPPFAGPVAMLAYLARYTHRVAIANHRLLSLHNGQVRFRWRDYAHGNRTRILTLSAIEFIRRFLLHVLPRRFVRIRHFGFLANPVRVERLARIRTLLGASDPATPAAVEVMPATALFLEPHATGQPCPACGIGRLICHALVPVPDASPFLPPRGIDSS